MSYTEQIAIEPEKDGKPYVIVIDYGALHKPRKVKVTGYGRFHAVYHATKAIKLWGSMNGIVGSVMVDVSKKPNKPEVWQVFS